MGFAGFGFVSREHSHLNKCQDNYHTESVAKNRHVLAHRLFLCCCDGGDSPTALCRTSLAHQLTFSGIK